MSRSDGEGRRPALDLRVPEKERSVEGKETARAPVDGGMPGGGWDGWVLRLLLAAAVSALSYWLEPVGLRGCEAGAAGLLAAGAILGAELRLRRKPARELAGGAAGAVVGLLCAVLVTLVVSRAMTNEAARSMVEFLVLFAFGYLGLVLGAKSGRELGWRKSVAGAENSEGEAVAVVKLLDTSVLIDGRIADICEAHFLDGEIAIPQFVLHELQLVADSSDGLKRQRGRRGLDVLERMQKIQGITVRVINDDSLHGADVDHKLIDVAQRTGAKIVTNDFNLNKVATLQGLSVLNVNQLANALKPAVLPGEPMQVYILREGKEANQGVAYLDDGTMVVVDGARKQINKTVEVIVTSVHQTTAGKMIFGRMDERSGESLKMNAAAAGREPGNG